MAIKPSVRVICDALCGAFVEGPDSTVARADAALKGWQFPKQRTANGRPSRRGHDVCPACAPTFEVKVHPRAKEWEGVGDEERRLTVFLKMHWNVVSPAERARLTARRDELKRARESES